MSKLFNIILILVCCDLDIILSSEDDLTIEFPASVLENAMVTGLVAPEALKTAPELLEEYDYPSEIHKVITEDGYILEMHRIPYGRTGAGSQSKRPLVFIQHGMMSSSVDFISFGPEQSLAMKLADAGYDVWLGNARGNSYSNQHVNLSNDEVDFWKFSWHEIGVYDLPAMMDYALNSTDQEKLFYIGHSQGTTVYYVLMSMKPEYNSKIKLTVALAPVAFMNHLKCPICQFLSLQLPSMALVDYIENIYGSYKFEVNHKLFALIAKLFCNELLVTKRICAALWFQAFGDNMKNQNFEWLSIFLGHLPSSISLMQGIHYMQEIQSGHFRQYDYGKIKNKQIYGQEEPPDYNLRKISSNNIMFYSKNDWLSSEIDVIKLYKILPKAELYIVRDTKFNHMDYIVGKNAPQIVYSVVLNKLSKYR